MHPPTTKGRKLSERTITTSDEEDLKVVPVASFLSDTTIPIKTLSKSQIKKRERGDARLAKYMVKFNNDTTPKAITQTKVIQAGRSDGDTEGDSEVEDESGFETTSSID